ncbi:Cobalt import ATP-binding protein [Mycoplasmopsis bovigenitalium 51080]|uniref:Cobalt import ATP-binding protein n=1 Tax=Mycoplasmopsis bovigenitalium 51080 TaxID=1188235 RepID=N9TVF3_9BACT|nr:energy-coupling factor transporter ATPase [Mycoplasmopsis bovigenitalium]ENY70114.1 Cobalt import ATP-binding protein [Mycoplasmopsis bovigenitalium 51080]
MISVKNLIFKYPGNENNAIDDVSFEIEQGKYIAILGHNGSGKSTLSKLLVALYKPKSGSISIDGTEINSKNLRKIRQQVGIIFQNPDNQFVGATIEDDIAFGLENKGIKREEMKPIIDELSKKVGMAEHITREPHLLSGGQKQRVAIASVLALDPKVIIFDEVTSMLDPLGKKQVLKLIRDIQQTRKKTLISITHDMDEAILADYCIVFAKGKIIAQGSPKEILKNKEVLHHAKIESPFIYKLSEKIQGLNPTFDESELLEAICK